MRRLCMEKIDVAFISLHYLTIDETIKSTEYIKKNIDTEKYHIVIVDNCSPNNTGIELQETYQDDIRVSVILNESNEGYARGLNKGIRFVRENYDCFFMVLMNNDIYLLDKSFCKKLQTEYEKSHFAILGPMILSGDGRCDTNPFREKMPSRSDIERMIERYRKILKNDKLYKYRWFLYKDKVIGSFYKRINKSSPKEGKSFWERQEDIVIHGSIMILSPEYFDCFEGLDPNTFMYAEEYVLYLHLKEKGLTEVYNPDILVMHAGSSSVGIEASQKAFDKRYYLAGHAVESLTYVAEMMKGN